MNGGEATFPRVFVVVLNYNGWQDTVACVESLLRLDPAAIQIVVVDNASSDGSVGRLRLWARGEFVPKLTAPDEEVSLVPVPKPVAMREYCSSELTESQPGEESVPLILIRNRENRGYAAGNNIGIRHAVAHGADAVWILNNDTVVQSDALGAMVDRLFSKRRPGLCGSLVRYFHDPAVVQCRGGGFTSRVTLLSQLDGKNIPVSEALCDRPEDVEPRLNFIYGASVMASREYVQTVGLMDEGYFLYCEEQDWAFSGKGHFDFAYAPQAHVFHKEGSSTGWSASQFRPLPLYWLTRSRLRLALRQCPRSLPVAVLGIVLAALRLVWRRMIRFRQSRNTCRAHATYRGSPSWDQERNS